MGVGGTAPAKIMNGVFIFQKNICCSNNSRRAGWLSMLSVSSQKIVCLVKNPG